MDILTTQTNLYAENRIVGEQLKENSRLQKWKPVSIDEMKVFLSLVIAMGLTHKGDMDAYWSKDEVIPTPFFSKMMAKDRFLNILSNLHLVNNAEADNDSLSGKTQ